MIETIEEAEALLEDLIKQVPDYRITDGFDIGLLRKHSKGVSKVAKQTTKEIRQNYDNFNVDPVEMGIAGMLHDVGKCLSDDFLIHAIVGGEYLELQGLHQIARNIRTHFTIREVLQIQESRGLNPDDFTPKTWNELVIIYADLHYYVDRISFEERINDLLIRRTGDGKQSIIMAVNRLWGIDSDIEELRNGTYNTDKLNKYSFLD